MKGTAIRLARELFCSLDNCVVGLLTGVYNEKTNHLAAWGASELRRVSQ